jgi:hypothetical protein
VADLTPFVAKAPHIKLSYKAMLNGAPPPDNAGNIVMTSYLVLYN